MEGTGPSARKPRQDAEDNRERVLAAAAPVILREGAKVPLATIAATAGVGVATLYRSFPDRDALLYALEFRAYAFLNRILDGIDEGTHDGTHDGAEDGAPSGLDCVGEFLTQALEIGDQLVLPLHGAPPVVGPDATRARRAINDRLERFIENGTADGSIRSPLSASDVIVFSALITQPLSYGPSWPTMAARQVANFLNGLATGGPVDLPGQPITQADIERAFARTTHEGEA